MRTLIFVKRNVKELLREPLSFVFCIGFPAVMLLIFVLINRYTGGATPMFDVAVMTPSICVFSYTFTTLFTALLVSKDRTSSFLSRLYVSPMNVSEFVLGYALPSMMIAICQTVLCLLLGFVIALCTGAEYMTFGGAVLCVVLNLPAMLLFVACGIIFGSLFSDKSAPGIASIMISGGGMLSGAWMPLETMGDFATFCRCLPFYPSVIVARAATALDLGDGFLTAFLTVVAYAAVICLLALPAFKKGKQK